MCASPRTENGLSVTRVTKIDGFVNIALHPGVGIAAPAPTADVMASALRWWHDMGVDTLIDEAPRAWLTAAVTAKRAAPIAAPQAPAKPTTREALLNWLMTADDVPEGGPQKRRVAPSGDPASGLMVVADLPDAADIESGSLLSGEIAALFDKMLAALRRDRSSIYLATLCPGRPPGGRLTDTAITELAPSLRAHIGFVAPKKLWLLGSAASRAVLGMNDIAAHGRLHSVNLNGVMVDVVVTAHPRFLTDADKKRRAWTEMQRLIEKDAQ